MTREMPLPFAVVIRPLIAPLAAVVPKPLTTANGESDGKSLFVQIVLFAKLMLAKSVRFIHELFSR